VATELLAHADSINREDSAEVGLDERADGVAAEPGGKNSRRGPDPSLPSESRRAGPRPDASLGNGPVLRRFDCGHDVLAHHTPRPDVVQTAVVRFPHDGIDGSDSFIARLRECP